MQWLDKNKSIESISSTTDVEANNLNIEDAISRWEKESWFINSIKASELYEEMQDVWWYINLPDNKKLDYRIYVMWESPILAELELTREEQRRMDFLRSLADLKKEITDDHNIEPEGADVESHDLSF